LADSIDERSQQWSIHWPDTRNPLDFSPLVGSSQNEIGLFYEDTRTPTGQAVRIRFTWDHVSEEIARWQLAFSFDNGETWDINWIAEFTR
jgi:hypothetical protein